MPSFISPPAITLASSFEDDAVVCSVAEDELAALSSLLSELHAPNNKAEKAKTVKPATNFFDFILYFPSSFHLFLSHTEYVIQITL